MVIKKADSHPKVAFGKNAVLLINLGTPSSTSKKDIKKNILSLRNLLNTSSSNPNRTIHRPKNLTKAVISSAAKLFLYLNTCPNTTKKENILYSRILFVDIFTNIQVCL